jgi:GNAT superfamily N-acetyltransferase
MPLMVDLPLARRLERAEGARGAAFVDSRATLEPAVRAAWCEIAGASVLYDGPDSMVTQTFGLGTDGGVRAEDLEAIESFFTERGSATQHEVCPLAGVATTAALVARGYVPVEMSNVLARPLDGLGSREDAPSGDDATAPRVRVAQPGDEAVWADTVARGWDMGPAFDDMLRGFARVGFARTGTTSFLAEIDGRPIASASLGMHHGVAVFAGAATIPGARRRGAQRALIAARLAWAKAGGCDVAMMAAEPGSRSQHNAERNGFRVAYTRTKWKRG